MTDTLTPIANVLGNPTIRAAYIGAFATGAAALGAFAYAYVVHQTSRLDRENRDEVDRRRTAAAAHAIAQTFSAEIMSLQTFLRDNDVISTLTAAAEGGGAWHFHPGHDWLKTYSYSPTTVGMLSGELPAQLTTYYCRMLNELGRLRWLHNLSEADKSRLTLSGLNNELQNSAKTLTSLFSIGDTLIERLDAAYRPSPPRVFWGREIT